jgi:hypothetical protein
MATRRTKRKEGDVSDVRVVGVHRDEPDLKLLAEALLEAVRVIPADKLEQLRQRREVRRD